MGIPAVVEELGGGRLAIDLGFRDTDGLIASYLLPGRDGDWSLVETGPASCRDRLAAGVARAGVQSSEVRRVFVTHIHLDHAGGLGSVAEAFPNATLYAHHAGVPHLVDPSRLVASARRAWGPASDTLWGTIAPVPPGRLLGLAGGEQFPVLGGELHVVATPGHASHHLSFFDSDRRAVLTGDSAGVRLPGTALARPAVPPPDLDLALLFESLERMAALDPRELWYAHFGRREGGAEELRTYRTTVNAWRDRALEVARHDPTAVAVGRALRELDGRRLDEQAVPAAERTRGDLISGYDLAAQGLLRYFRTRGLLTEPSG